MMWQDALFAVGGIVFALALVPAVLSGVGPPLVTCLSTGTFLAAFTVAYASLKLRFAAATTALSAALWFTLAIQQVA